MRVGEVVRCGPSVSRGARRGGLWPPTATEVGRDPSAFDVRRQVLHGGGRRAAAMLLVLCAGLLAGCSTKRTLTIDTEPRGARVWVNDRYVGESPVAVPFVHYGDFEVRLEKPCHHPWAWIVRVPTRFDG